MHSARATPNAWVGFIFGSNDYTDSLVPRPHQSGRAWPKGLHTAQERGYLRGLLLLQHRPFPALRDPQALRKKFGDLVSPRQLLTGGIFPRHVALESQSITHRPFQVLTFFSANRVAEFSHGIPGWAVFDHFCTFRPKRAPVGESKQASV